MRDQDPPPGGPTSEDLRRIVGSDPMRRMVRRRCRACGREWTQPAATGACPECHGGDVENLDVRVSVLPRV